MKTLAVVLWAVLLGGIFGTSSDEAGDDLVRYTVRLSLLYYLVAAVLMTRLDERGWQSASLARLSWVLAWLAYVVHLGMAFHFAHGWSHAAAMEHVEKRSGFGPGIFFSHLFTLLWTADVAWWLARPLDYAVRRGWVGRALHGFMLVITFNATVVYETGTIRWLGLAFFAVLAVAWIARRPAPAQQEFSMNKACLALALLAFPSSALAQTADEKKATLAFVGAREVKEGGFRVQPKAKGPSLRATSSSLRTLRYFGGSPADAEACKKFVLSCRDAKSGGFADSPGGKPDVVLTAVGLMALVELKAPTAPYEKDAIAFMAANAVKFEEIRMAAAGLETIGKSCDKNEEWLKVLDKMAHADGTFGDGDGKARDTGGAVAAVLRLGGKVRDKTAVLEALNGGQRKDGGFGKVNAKVSDLETSYRVMRTFVMLKSKPTRSTDLRTFVAKCRTKEGGYAVEPGGDASIGGTYFASILLHWLDAK